ncbi:transposase [Klebsormidium nitens]|uniref:Transposase n=1 Tax=Klebsormidium nitens TaxID=105231 RepID=A0A1Y1IBV9_KLENI|nr:transposase [Klebsormidium nitens]|eukprot:GAQ88445.1 transposase [Klebsormidium nitens]
MHAEAATELDLRTPARKGKEKVTGFDAAGSLPPARQLRRSSANKPWGYRGEEDSAGEEDAVSEEVEEGSQSDGQGSQSDGDPDSQSDSEEEAAGPATAGPATGQNRGRPPGKRTVVFQKRAVKPAGRKRVSKKLLEGASSGSEEEGESDEELEKEGEGPLDKGLEAGPSGPMHWEPVAEGDVLEDVQPPAFTGPSQRDVVFQTNLYAAACREEAGLPGNKGRVWVNVTLQEVMRWFGLVFAMALHPLPALAHYWRIGVQGAVRLPGFGEFMSLKRFEQIKRYLHTNDNAQRPPDRATREYRLWHLMPLLNHMEETFPRFYNPTQFVTFDERMIPLRNRGCPVRVYNPKKPHKFGVELFCAVDSVTFYCYFQWVYDKVKVEGDGLHDMIVRKLGDRVPKHRGHVIILDRGFTGPLPVRALKEANLLATGTCLPNRKMFPKELLQLGSKAERGSMRAAVCEEDGMVAVAWQDKKPVFFLSTCHGLSLGETGRRVAGTREEVTCPEIAYEYNKFKDGVDQFDKSCLMVGYGGEMELVSRKWWVRVMFGLLDGAMHNAYVLYHEAHPEVSRWDFLLALQQQLVENTYDNLPGARKRGRSEGAGTATTGSDDRDGHTLERVKGASNRCRVCYAMDGKAGRKVNMKCGACGVFLCPGACDRDWHTLPEFAGTRKNLRG